MTYRVEIDPRATVEIEKAYLWLAGRSPMKAVEWFNDFHDAIESLQTLPMRCPLVPERDAFPEEVRQLLYGKRGGVYRILFTVTNKTVRVLRVRHGARLRLSSHKPPSNR